MARKILRWQVKFLKERKAPDRFARVFRIRNELGLHARAAAQFVKVASRYRSEILVSKNAREVNGKSIMGILMLAASKGSTIRVTTVGDDCREAMGDIGALIEGNFGENK